jgi:hypothetical protein
MILRLLLSACQLVSFNLDRPDSGVVLFES